MERKVQSEPMHIQGDIVPRTVINSKKNLKT